MTSKCYLKINNSKTLKNLLFKKNIELYMNKLIFLMFKNYKSLIFILIMLCAQAYFTLTLPQYTANIIDFGIKNSDINYIINTGEVMIILTILAAISTIIVSYLSSNYSSEYGNNLRKLVFLKILKFSNHEFNNISKASLLTITINDIENIEIFLEKLFTIVIIAPIIGFGGIIKSIEMGTRLSWIIALTFIVIIVLIIPIVYKFMPYIGKLELIKDSINITTREILIGIPVIKTFVRQDYEKNKFNKVNEEYKYVQTQLSKHTQLLTPLLTLHMSLMITAILYLGAYEVVGGNLLTGELMAFIQYASQIVLAFLMVQVVLFDLPDVFVSFKRINKVLYTELSIVDGEIDTIENDKLTIEFKNVSYNYSKSEKDALTNINFKLEPGKTVAIIGGIGSGKSTILNLIPRLDDPTTGEILINGENIKHYKLSTLREKICLTPQKAQIFKGTIKSNMKIINEQANDKDIVEALNKANVDFIESLDDEVLEDGSNFSSGQKQRLSIARSFLKKCDFYLFDDCFSALDKNTEKIVTNNLSDLKDSSILIVSQRISTIKDADEILVMKNGEIIDRGTHNKLVERCNIYKEIVKTQQGQLGD